ncbi:MAG: transcription initiation factor IIB [Promethearchaeota archaeon]
MSDTLEIKNRRHPENDMDYCREIHCIECGSTNVICDDTRGEIICNDCGVVIEEHMVDTGPEWRSYTTEERNKRDRVGSPMNFSIHDKGLSTMIGPENKDFYGKSLAPRRRAEIYRLRKWQRRTRTHSSRDRNLIQALSELDRLASQMGIPKSIKEEAAIIYRKALESKMSRSTSIESLVAASLYAACRIRKIPRTLDEVAEKSHVNKKQLGQAFRLLARRVEMSIPLSSPIDFIPRFANDLGLSGSVSKRAIKLLKKAKQVGITAGKDPTGMAAATLYIAGILEDERRTQREIARVARVTEVTVRNRYKELVKNLQIAVAA